MAHRLLSRPRRLLWLILALAVVLRLGAAVVMGDAVTDLPGIHDQITYDALSKSILAGRGYSFERYWYPFTPAHTPTSHWSFLYPFYLAGVYAVLGYHPLAARLIQGALSGALAAWLIYRLGKRLFGERVGLAAAALSAVYIYSAYYDAALMTESFYIVGVLAMLNLALDITDGTGRPAAKWAMLGVTLGITTLLRQSILPWVPVLLLWILWAGRGRVRWAHALIPLVIVAGFIAPWTIRNYRAYGEFLLLNSNTGYAMYSAQHPMHGVRFREFDAAPLPTLIGFVAGAAVILVVAVLILRMSKRLPLKPFFTGTTAIMLLLAFNFTGAGIRELQEAGLIGATLLPIVPENLILSETLGLYPTLETILAQVIFVAAIVVTFSYSRWQGTRKVSSQPAPSPSH